METSDSVTPCAFSHAEALEFDPELQRLMGGEPMARIRMPYGEGEAWLATRYEDVRLVTTDRRFSRRALIGRDFPRMTPAPIVQDEAINLMDPPDYLRIRRLVARGFTTRHVEDLRPSTQRTVDRLLDAMVEHGPPADVAGQLAAHLPMATICDLLDIPEDDRGWLRANAIALMNRDDREAAVRAKAEMRAYFTRLTAERRGAPGQDLLSRLCAARDELAREQGDVLDDEELAVLGMVLMMTGHDTTTYQISNLAYTLLTHPEQLAKLRARPDTLPEAIEELLRYIPFRKGVGIPRVATEDVRVGGVLVREGETVHVSYLAANRDPGTYPEADALDLERDGAHHMTFGWGTHHCLGSHLARMELQTAIGTLLTRFPRLRLAVPAEEIQWNTSSIWRYPLTLPVAW